VRSLHTPVRPLRRVPVAVWAALLVGLGSQILWHAAAPAPAARYRPLPAPPPAPVLRIASLGEPALASRLLSLWLQAHDTQPGLSVPLSELDYERVTGWLGRALDLDPRSDYPLLAATRIYASVADDTRRRRMLDFVEERFLEAPQRRWRWMAEAAIIAKHRLGDLPLALRYARAIAEHAPGAPGWARDMAVAVLEDMGELEAARILVGGLLHEGELRDPREIRFLERKLEELEARLREHDAGAADPDAAGGARAPSP